MKLDLVHDLQAVYRKMVDSTSRPGLISNLQKEAELLEADIQTDCTASLIVVALTLLDQEVSFKVVSENEETVSAIIHQYTYAKPANIEQADYIFVLKDAKASILSDVLTKAKPGTLRNPQHSATVFIEAEEVRSGGSLLLKGPGIQSTVSVEIVTQGDWIEVRQEKNKEYPLGIDLMFVDGAHQLLSLPRTTQITENRVMI
ncbi:phosphonate C-P lyase system protein PhnH [Bacillus timonensis]|uniref:phosphonate C-P lyase system protein PhnH n=1 Tax=Bacillus timonensis TaxID=1033734 RepID=UPI000288C1C9|nr:phosphonate C-P lyase system protein PhnH [Bacillus timonensis]